MAALVAMAKSMWLTCPNYRQPMLCADLTRYINVIEEGYESNNLQDMKNSFLKSIIALLEHPDTHGASYGDGARRLALSAGFPTKPPKAFSP